MTKLTFCKLTSLLLLMLIISGCGLLKKSEPYKMSVKLIEESPQAKALIGDIEKFGWFPMGSIKTSGDSGTADLSTIVFGTKQKAKLITKAVKNMGEWNITNAILKAKDGTTLDLLETSSQNIMPEETATPLRPLTILKTFYSDKAWGKPIDPPDFSRDQTIFFHVITTNLSERTDGKFSFSADLTVLDPKGTMILSKNNIIEATDYLENGELPINFNITLPENTPSGIYKVQPTIKDLTSENIRMIDSTFNVK